jgi:hypothetical protein
MGKGGRNADDINNKFSERQKEYETMNKPFMPTNPPVFSMQETTEAAISVFGTEKIPSAILTPNSRRDRKSTRE